MSESDREERIRQRAYERYQQRGADDGRDFDDWLGAEREENEQFDSTKHPPVDIPEAPSEGPASSMPGTPTGDNHGKDDKINEAAEESFPASDAPAWRGGSAN